MGQIEPWGFGDVLVDRERSGEEISEFLRRILGLRADEVALIDDLDQVLGLPASTKVVCQRSLRNGEAYPMMLSLWGTLNLALPFAKVVAEFCKALDCRCLIDDGSISPYSWQELDGDGNLRVVTYYGP